MSRVFNFSAGPSTLPVPVLERAQEELLDYRGRGMSIVEMSHRSPEYTEIHESATALVKELLSIPDGYHVRFLAGGATLQFGMIPMNLLTGDRRAAYTNTGAWAKKAIADAAQIGAVDVVFDGTADSFSKLPSTLSVDPKATYLHLTSNETIGGLQWHSWPETSVPIVCDMSSDILSRRIPMERFGLIYAGAQKNLGPAGTTLVIIRDDLLEKCRKDLPAYLSYGTHVKKAVFNTPPVFSVYMCRLSLEWLKELGGLEVAEARAKERAGILYDAIAASGGFYKNPINVPDRSLMNVVFTLPSDELAKKFLAEAGEHKLVSLKGHRSVGGCRASLYNAMPIEGAHALTSFMKTFAADNG